MTRQLFASAVLVCCALSVHAADLEIKDSQGSHTDILHDGKILVRYMYARDESTDAAKHNTYKVYYHVFDPSGKEPITKGPGGKYTHHRGMFIGFSKLTSNGKTSDLWHMTGTLQRHMKFVKKEVTADKAILSSVIHWTVSDATIVEETRTLTIHDSDEAHMLVDFVSELKAVGSAAKFGGDPEHAGMQYRPHNGVAENKSAKYIFPEPKTNVQKEVDLRWAALTYQLADATYSVQHMNHPENPKGTRYSAYRDYGRFGAFPTFEVGENETRILRYRIRVTLGDVPSREVLNAEYKKFVAQ